MSAIGYERVIHLQLETLEGRIKLTLKVYAQLVARYLQGNKGLDKVGSSTILQNPAAQAEEPAGEQDPRENSFRECFEDDLQALNNSTCRVAPSVNRAQNLAQSVCSFVTLTTGKGRSLRACLK